MKNLKIDPKLIKQLPEYPPRKEEITFKPTSIINKLGRKAVTLNMGLKLRVGGF